MYDLIDLHCHILSSVDDGAYDDDMMKSMLDIAYNDGIKAICFTPHFKIHQFKNDEHIRKYNLHIERVFSSALEYVNEKYSDMKIYLGNEVMFHNDICNSLSTGKCRFLADSSYVLVEFKPETPMFDIENIVSKILRKGYIPVIAHIERYSALVNDPSKLKELRGLGALLQINAGSILKFWFGKTARFIKNALKNKLVDIICTDAHNDKELSPILSKAHDKIFKRYGEEYAKMLFFTTPNAIINNVKIY
ncbi:MAG: PHP domain-containing protein [Clostridia bacterium]|nr:PHP domain-containing protein [Clostridia bacterium]